MARLAVFCPPLAGHLHPFASLAAELRRRGPEVTFVGIGPARAAINQVRAEAGLGDLPGEPVVSYAPQQELIRRAKLAVTHAGLKWTGAGVCPAFLRLTAAGLRTAVETVLADPKIREAAVRMAAAIARSGGVTRAADLAEHALEGRKTPAHS